MKPIIEVRNLSKRYMIGGPRAHYQTLRESITSLARNPLRAMGLLGTSSAVPEIWALRDVSFDVMPGEVIGIIGRNGAGKSTLLKLLTRVTEPTSGESDLFGRVASLLEVGTGFHPELTGRENIFLNGAILGMRRKEILRKFDEIVAFAELEEFLETPVKRYSSGMYVRLAFAVAAFLESEILLIDEVLAVGDAGFQQKCLGKVADVVRHGRTVLFVSHNMGAIRGLCHTAIWLDRGIIALRGTVGDVVSRYLGSVLPEGSSTIEVADIPRVAGGGDRLRILKVELNNGQPVFHGDPIKISIQYRTSVELQGVAFGVGFSSLEGTRLMTFDSDLFGDRYTLPPNLQGAVVVSTDAFHLQPGRYSFDVAARSGDNWSLDYLPACGQVEVLPGPRTPSVIIRESGCVRMPGIWIWN